MPHDDFEFRRLSHVRLYVPDLKAAVAYYQQAGLRAELVVSAEAPGTLCARLYFPEGTGHLELHTDPRQQFTDVQIAVSGLEQAYRRLSLQPRVLWLEPPHVVGGRRQAVVRGLDGNVLRLTEEPPPPLSKD